MQPTSNEVAMKGVFLARSQQKTCNKPARDDARIMNFNFPGRMLRNTINQVGTWAEEKEITKSVSGLHVLHDPLHIKFVNCAEFVDSYVVISPFVVDLSHFSDQSLSGTACHPGEIHDIPVAYNETFWQFFQ